MTKCGLQITNPNNKYKLKNPKRKNAKQTQKKNLKKIKRNDKNGTIDKLNNFITLKIYLVS